MLDQLTPSSFFEFFFKTIPDMPLPDIIIHVVAMLGVLLITYAVFLEAEKRQDFVFLIGGMCLMVYALSLKSPIFVLAMLGLITASTYEIIQIMRGKHHHVCYPDQGNQNKISNI